MKIDRQGGPRASGTRAVLTIMLLLSCAVPVRGQPAATPPPAPDGAEGPVAPLVTPPVTVPQPAAARSVASPVLGDAVLPRDLSLRAMFLHADIVVQSVMTGLLFASVITWTVLLAKGLQLVISGRRLQNAVRQAERGESLRWFTRPANGNDGPTSVMVAATLAELKQSEGSPNAGTKERVASRLRRIETGFARRMARGTGLLATIGATAPFVGLFGTVWGIMNSFIGISKSQTTNLAVVAPGIAEALLATAAGLIAAIPAVVIYNMFSRATGTYRANLGDLAAAIERMASRELDVRRPPLRAAAE
jgi:biopolymer transport protein ExbB